MRGNESFCEYLGVLLDRHQSPDCQPHRPLPVDVEVDDLLPTVPVTAALAVSGSSCDF